MVRDWVGPPLVEEGQKGSWHHPQPRTGSWAMLSLGSEAPTEMSNQEFRVAPPTAMPGELKGSHLSAVSWHGLVFPARSPDFSVI